MCKADIAIYVSSFVAELNGQTGVHVTTALFDVYGCKVLSMWAYWHCVYVRCVILVVILFVSAGAVLSLICM